MKKVRQLLVSVMSLIMLSTLLMPMNAFAVTTKGETDFTAMLERAEALVNYEWIPSERIYTWNDNEYNGKNYFEAGETVKGVPYTLFSWELGFDSLLSLEQFKTKSSVNYSTEKYCNSVSANRIGPAYGNCCATLVSEVFGGLFMNGSNPKYDGVGTVQDSTYSTTYTKVKVNAIQPGDALSCTSGSHIVWVGGVSDDSITIYESTPPICQKVVLNKNNNTDNNGYLVYNGNTYNIVTKSNELIRDDLSSAAPLLTEIPLPIHSYTVTNEKTLVYDAINGNVKANKIYGTDLCFIDAIFDNGWCHVNFPLDSGGLEHGYVQTSVFFNSGDIVADTARSSIPAYTRSNLSTPFGRISSGSKMYSIDETTDAFQVIYSVTSGGYKLGWVSKKDLENASEDVFLNQFCPIKGYPCVTEKFEVKKEDYSTRGGEIYITDYCTINEVYNDGWCQVTFPMDSGGTRTAYTPISNFIYDVNYEAYSYVTQEEINVYSKKDIAVYNNWRTGNDDTIYILGEYNDALQICYPIVAAYGGGYKLGWVSRSSISVNQDKLIKSISISSFPEKTAYYIGEELDLTGLELLLEYSNNSTEFISDGFEVAGFDSAAEGTKIVTVSYGGKAVSFSVIVKPVDYDKSPQFIIEKNTAKAGETIDVQFKIQNAPKLKSFSITGLSYDVSKLNFEKAVCNIDGVAISQVQPNGNAIAAFNSNTDINGLIFTYTFTVKENVEDCSIPISCTFSAKEKPNGGVEQAVAFETVAGEIAVKNYVVGDLNGDDVVDSDDSIYLLWYTYLPDDYPINQNADFNGDGTVDSDDSIYLLWHTYLPEDYSLN